MQPCCCCFHLLHHLLLLLFSFTSTSMHLQRQDTLDEGSRSIRPLKRPCNGCIAAASPTTAHLRVPRPVSTGRGKGRKATIPERESQDSSWRARHRQRCMLRTDRLWEQRPLMAQYMEPREALAMHAGRGLKARRVLEAKRGMEAGERIHVQLPGNTSIPLLCTQLLDPPSLVQTRPPLPLHWASGTLWRWSSSSPICA